MTVSRLSIIKFFELAIAITCVGLHYKRDTGNFNTDTLSAVAFGGYIIILLAVFFGYLTGNPINKRIDIFFSLVGVAVFVAAGALNIEEFKNYYRTKTRDYGLSKASLAIINGAFFFVDAILTWRGDF